jgi:Fe-S cluster biogenesis protein NfuA
VEELVRAVLTLHGAGLEHLLNLLDEPQVRQLVGDDLVAGLLLLHDLHLDDVATRIQGALDSVRPYLGSHAGGIDYLGIDDDGVVHLSLQGSCEGCPGSTATVRLTVENAVLDAAPEAIAVDVAGMVKEKDNNRLTCPRCTAEYDVRLAGRAVTPEGAPPLDALPLLPEGSGWKVAIPGVQPT